MRKLTRDEWITRYQELHGLQFSYERYTSIGVDLKSVFVCKDHGEFVTTSRRHLKEHGSCPGCMKALKLSKRIARWEKLFKAKYGDKFVYDWLGYAGVKDKFKVYCPIHRKWYLMWPSNHLGREGILGCPECGKEARRMSADECKQRIEKTGFSWTFKKEGYISGMHEIPFTCKEHGIFAAKPNEVSRGKGCKSCKRIMNGRDFIKKARQVHKNTYSYNNLNYQDSVTPVNITCKKHGDYRVYPFVHLKGSHCPQCYHENRFTSRSEEILLSLFSEYTCLKNDRTLIAPQELDLYIPELNLAIESNGEYWHSENKGKGEKYHLDKTERCLEKDVRLLHFWDSEVRDKFNIVSSMIGSVKKESKRIFARTTTCREISSGESRKFLDENHLQGFSPAKVHAGLFADEVLVSVATFSSPRFNKRYEWELIRLATKLNFTIIGGASKLLKHFERKCTPENILSYADRRYSTGEVYRKLGFTQIATTKPSYFYNNGDKRISRYKAQKSKLGKLLGSQYQGDLTEKQNMVNARYHRVFDCGQLVFVKYFTS